MAVKSTDNNSLFFATGLDNSGLSKGKIDAENIITSLGRNISKINPFAALAIGALAAFATISAGAYKMARTFEHAMKEVETISDATQKDFKGISKEVFELTKITPDSPEKLANAYYQIVSAGYDGAKGLKLLEVASKSAVAGVTDTTTAADGLTTVLNAFGIEAENVNQVADVMFKTVQLGKTTFSELASNLSTVAPIASASGISFEQVAGAIATLTKQGVPTAQAMTQIRSAIIGANEALGDGWSKAMSLQDAFKLLYEKADGSQTKLQEMVGRVEAVSAVLGIAGKNAKGAASDLDAMTNSVGSSEDAFKRMSSSNVNQWEILRNRIKATTKGIGDAVLGMSNSIVGSLNDALDSSDDLREGIVKQRAEFNRLVSELDDVNTGFERKKEILKLLKDSYPGYLKSLDIDKISNQNLSKALQLVKGDLEDINKLHERRIELSAYDDAVNVAQRNKDNAQNTYNDQLEFFKKELKKIEEYAADPKNGITLNYKFSDTPQEIFSSVEKSLGNNDVGFSKTASLTRDLGDALQVIVNVKPKLEETTKELEKQQKLLSGKEIKYGNEEGFKDVIEKINQINKLSSLDSFKVNYDRKEIVEAIKIREGVIKTISSINSISKAEYKKGKLSEFLKSENAEIKEAAEKRKAFFDFKPSGGEKEDKRTDIEKFEDSLKIKEKQFKSYNLAIKNKDDELAKKLKENYRLKEADYITYLRNLYSITQNDGSKSLILEELDKQGTGLKPREKVTALEVPTFGIKEIQVDPNFTLSIDYLNKELVQLQEKLNSSTNDLERKRLAILVQFKQEEIEIKKGVTSKIQKVEENNYDFLGLLSLKKIRQKKKEAEKLLQIAKDKAAKEAALSKNGKATIKTQKEVKQLEDNLIGVAESFGDALAGVMGQVSSGLSGVADLFSKFGDDETAKLLNQFAGVADGIGKIASGDIIGGSIDVLKSALTVEVVSDTAKFEAAIKELEKAIDKLDYVISKSVGGDKIDNRKNAIADLEELEKQADLAYKAEEKARKQVKFLGIKLWSKGSGSGTDPAKLEELEQKMEDARRKAEELKSQLDELYTGTNEQSIVDTIISGLREGKKDVQDFADDIKSILQNALLQAFQIKYLEDEIDEFYKLFSAAGSDQNYTAEELSSLVNYINSIITGAQDEIEAINDVLEQAGIGGLGSGDSQQGLAGAISTITEETANVLAGTLNSIRIDVANGLEIAQQSSNYLAQIVQNTSYNHFLESMDNRLNNIESLLS
ncbi:phage tail tape measure protein [Tenacibaculum maritimum]|nr:phage tail tape measure protein [Tenacibaculum maritimum]MDB0600334.1 phage tail tape measure protein [Tenacibaculum maritimum]MDB0610844.1 phage tail tape measure protein [Tenacibaculum maritimum]